jgi:hypothetical protein
VSNSLSYVAHAILLRTQHFVVDIFPETERLRFSYIKYLEILLYYSHLFCSLVFLLYTSISEENTASIFTDEMKNIRMWIIYVRICGGLSQEIYSQKTTEHGCKVKSKPVPLHHTRAEGGRRYNSYSFMISALDRGEWSGSRTPSTRWIGGCLDLGAGCTYNRECCQLLTHRCENVEFHKL